MSKGWVLTGLLVLLAGVGLSGLPIPVMEVDAAQYASIAAEMIRTGSFLEVLHRGWDYLDKPPLLFWSSAASMKLFGLGGAAYKLHSVLVLGLGAYSIYGYTKLFHAPVVARASGLIFGSTVAFLHMSNDCRTDGLLIGFSALATWKLTAFVLHRKPFDLVLGAVGVGLAMLSKGPLGFVFPMIMVAPTWWRHRRTQGSLWLLAIPIVGIVLLPMCIGLYRQHGPDGLKFFFWTQSFGRITGESEWANDADPLLLLHTLLWCFLPWTVVLLAGLGRDVRSLVRGNGDVPEHGAILGLVLILAALSLSRYKLPHYAYIACVPAAVISARQLARTMAHGWLIAHRTVLVLVVGLTSAMTVFFLDRTPVGLVLLLAGGLVLAGLTWSFIKAQERDLVSTVLAWAIAGLQLNLFFYPQLLRYQASSEAAFLIQDLGLEDRRLVGFHWHDHALSFYLDKEIPFLQDVGTLETLGVGTLVYTDHAGMRTMQEAGLAFDLLGRLDRYEVANLTFQFLDPRTRREELDHRVILELVRE